MTSRGRKTPIGEKSASQSAPPHYPGNGGAASKVYIVSENALVVEISHQTIYVNGFDCQNCKSAFC